MATYPSAIKSFTNPLSTDHLNSPSHSTQHTQANDEITAIETQLGTNPSGTYTDVTTRLAAIPTYSQMGATFTVAASDASAADIAMADYTCDGTDDHVQIQAAVDAASALGGGKVYLSEGNFLGDSVAMKSNVEVEGSGWHTIYKLKDAITAPGFYFLGTDLANIVKAKISKMRFNGNKAGCAEAPVKMWFATDCEASDLWIYDDTGTAISLVRCIDCRIFRCRIKDGEGYGISVGTGGDGGLDPSLKCIIADNYITSMALDGIYIDQSATGCTIRNNVIGSCTRYGIIIDQSPNNLLDGNIIHDNTSYSIYIANATSDGYSSGNVVSNNIIKTSGNDGIHLQGGGIGTTIKGNVVSGNVIGTTVTGIAISNIVADNTVISGNHITNTYNTGIYVLSSAYCTIVGNTVKDSSQQTNNTYAGIQLLGTTTYCTVTGNSCIDIAANKSAYNILEDTGSDKNVIIGNITVGGVSGKVGTVGANTIYQHNQEA